MRYRGAIGQWSWVLHRLTGLGVIFFLVLHVIDTSWAVFYPELYVEAIAAYQSPLFTVGEFGLVFAVVYHALNGLRIVLMDFRPDLWKYQQQAAYYVIGATVIILVPVFILMFDHVLDFYSESPAVKSVFEAAFEQWPFIAGIVVAGIAALLFSVFVGTLETNDVVSLPRLDDRLIERFWWSFMRISGLLIVPLVFGHLAFMHILQGVFDLTAQNHTIVGVASGLLVDDGGALIGNGLNDSGTSVEFVAERWGFLWNGIAIWKVYDIALLALVVTHGFNGLRYVLTDYVGDNPLLHRTVIYFCTIGAIVLLVQGGWALLSSIDQTKMEMAVEAVRSLSGG